MKHQTLLLAIAAASFVVFVAFSWSLIIDDAFIGFRYAKNLSNGHGMV